jgi:cell fate regulator YaaT (PSP1 superfamily)
MNIDTKFSIKNLQIEFNNTVKRLHIRMQFVSRMQGWFKICKSINVI